ncbi:MAG: hypothetical protein H6822_29370 [Planctomycetaceae bacterium]|nr:hypothetical protein [Planctomycetales bacterium]MCB9926293.1 hypothetical protein [Planctomycetaceae bacterium]
MPRTKDSDHDFASLMALADDFREAANNIEDAARYLRKARLQGTVAVAYQAPMNSGIANVAKFVRSVKMKVDDASMDLKLNQGAHPQFESLK